MIGVCLTVYETSYLFSTVVAPFHIPPTCVGVPVPPRPQKHLPAQSFILAVTVSAKWHLVMVLICISGH